MKDLCIFAACHFFLRLRDTIFAQEQGVGQEKLRHRFPTITNKLVQGWTGSCPFAEIVAPRSS